MGESTRMDGEGDVNMRWRQLSVGVALVAGAYLGLGYALFGWDGVVAWSVGLVLASLVAVGMWLIVGAFTL